MEKEKDEEKNDEIPVATMEDPKIGLGIVVYHYDLYVMPLSGNSNFAFDLLKKASNDKNYAGKNILISPLSTNIALSLLTNGATGEMQNGLQKYLGYETLTIDEMNAYHTTIQKTRTQV